MLSGFILWDAVVNPVHSQKRVSVRQVFLATPSTVAICGPFILHQYSAYPEFCTRAGYQPPWCSAIVPSIYGYVQAKYWNSGFLLYWTPAQLPNILLATPILLSIFAFTHAHLKTRAIPSVLRSPLFSSLFPSLSSRITLKPTRSVFFNDSITPHVIHAYIICCILLFAAHTQITLGLAASMPTTYWAAARLLVDYPRLWKWWVTWSVVWGVISVVLFAVFLPPA